MLMMMMCGCDDGAGGVDGDDDGDAGDDDGADVHD